MYAYMTQFMGFSFVKRRDARMCISECDNRDLFISLVSNEPPYVNDYLISLTIILLLFIFRLLLFIYILDSQRSE